jgi:membrane-associated phospholipid phosphatase
LFLTKFHSQASEIRWLSVMLVGNFLIPFWIILYLGQKGVILDDTLENTGLYRERLIALWPISFILAGEVIAMTIFHIHEPLFGIFLSSLAVTIIGGLISYYWKISAHALGLASAITLLVFLIRPWALIGAIAIPILAWARLTLNRHTPLQLAIGIIMAPIIIAVVLRALGLI